MVCPGCKKMLSNDVVKCPKCGYQIVEMTPEEERRIHELVITTSQSVEGYKVVKYLGIVSGESSLGTGFLSEFLAGTSDFFGW